MCIRSKISGIIVFTLLFGGCAKKNPFPDEPTLEFVLLQKIEPKPEIGLIDPVMLSFRFTDGDGDIGHHEPDSATAPSLLVFPEVLNGIWEEIDMGEITFHNVLPFVTPEGKNKSIEGEIDIKLHIYYPPGKVNKGDTMRYRCNLVDRAGNISNEVISSEIIVSF